MRLAVMLFTHCRPFYATRTLRSLLDNIENCELHVHIADDASPAVDVEALAREARGHAKVCGVTTTQAGGRGYGGSYNAATQVVHELSGMDALLPLEDDWELTRRFDPVPYVECLRDGMARSIRMGYVGVTGIMEMRTRLHNERVYLELHPRSTDPHVFSGHPRLETIEYQRDVGIWPEHVNPGATEFEVAHRLAARTGVFWPGDIPLTGGLWAHIGTIQARDDQRAVEHAG